MKIDVKHVAKLAKLELTEDELKRFESQLSSVLEYIENLQKVDTKDTEETSQTTGLENVSRDDIGKPSLEQKEALTNTKSQENGFFKVKAIFEDNE